LRNVNNAGRDAVDAEGASGEGAWGGRRRRVVPASRRWCQFVEATPRRRWPKSPCTEESTL